MKVIIIGTIVKDTLRYRDGTESHSFGGLLHTINAAKALLHADDRIVPVSFVGTDAIDEVGKLFSNDPRISTNGLIPLNGLNNRVELTYTSDSERIEKSVNPMPTIEFENLGNIFPADLVIINMISGWDISLDLLIRLRRKFSGIIALDLHSLTLNRDNDGTRTLRRRDDLSDWTSLVDIVQMNEKEYAVLAEGDQPPDVFFEDACVNGGKIINLTKGRDGSATYFGSENGIAVHHQSVRENIEVVDPTGCGDAFLAAFSIKYRQTGDIRQAAGQANLVAALSGGFRGLADPEILKQQLDILTREVQ